MATMNSQDGRAQQGLEAARRALRPGATLLELAQLLGRPAWLASADVQAVSAIAGKIPVQLLAGDSVLALHLAPAPQAPAWVLYLRVEGRLSPAELLDVLQRAGADHPAAARRIQELGWVEAPR